MTDQFQFELVSPEKLVISKQVTMVTVPGGEGDYGVLVGHAPLITTVRPGIIDIYEQDTDVATEKIFVAGGFAETTTDRCTVLAEEATPISELDRAKVEQDLKRASEDAATAKSEDDRIAFETHMLIAKAKLEALDSKVQA